jgi:NAD(P)-dependent dehydrogenase (short-subunit alcohol dehydrogenase family)
MDLGITGRAALVAGGSKGIGKAAALLLAGEKCRLAIVARGQEAIDQAVAECRALGAEAVGVSADLTSQAGVE